MSWIDDLSLDPANDVPNGTVIDNVLWGQKITQRFLDVAARIGNSASTLASLSSNWIHDSTNALTYQLFGGIVLIQGAIVRQNSALAADGNWAGNPIFTLPTGYRPPSSGAPVTPIPAQATTAGSPTLQVRVQSSGQVQIRNRAGNAIAVGDTVNINGVVPLG